MLISIIALGLSSTPTMAQDEMRLQMTGQGRFTYFADLDSLHASQGSVRHLKALQLSEPMQIGDATYVGGWSNWLFDCQGRTAQRLDFSSLKSDGTQGPVTPTRNAPYPLVAGGDAAELAAVACGEVEVRIDARSLDEARRLAED